MVASAQVLDRIRHRLVTFKPETADIACTDGQPRSNEHLIFYLKERRESVSYTHVQSADRLGSRMLPVI
ncbi:hypothetical protein HZ326_22118 [Fusarium oxysporum f. sp. albedinis]|nr:hypothetical protein HZ326_22118 [Fusarium oxysporum f. sp. albedinis]